jgi:hypothetical protein
VLAVLTQPAAESAALLVQHRAHQREQHEQRQRAPAGSSEGVRSGETGGRAVSRDRVRK